MIMRGRYIASSRFNVFERMKDMSKIRVIVDIDIDDEICTGLGVAKNTTLSIGVFILTKNV